MTKIRKAPEKHEADWWSGEKGTKWSYYLTNSIVTMWVVRLRGPRGKQVVLKLDPEIDFKRFSGMQRLILWLSVLALWFLCLIVSIFRIGCQGIGTESKRSSDLYVLELVVVHCNGSV